MLLTLCSGEGVPAAALPAGFVDAGDAVPGLVEDVRYAGDNNFVGRRIDGYVNPRCVLTQQAAAALKSVQDAIMPQGFGIKVFDCYRPVRAVAHFARWAREPKDNLRKADFYPNIDKKDLFRLGYIARRSSHSRGSTADLTLIELASGREVDMGTHFDLFDARAGYAHPGITSAQKDHRARLRSAMQAAGFAPFDKEWWHFTLRDEPFPKTYFDFVVE